MLETTSDLALRWRQRGVTRSPEQWAHATWADVLAQFLVVENEREHPVGWVCLFRANFQDGHANLSVARFADQRTRSPLVVLGLALFLQYTFTCWNFRKLYLSVPEYNLSQFESAVGRYVQIEGCLRDHSYFDGRYWDHFTLALYRRDWERYGGRVALERGKRNPGRSAPRRDQHG
jgi:hypothetical protein